MQNMQYRGSLRTRVEHPDCKAVLPHPPPPPHLSLELLDNVCEEVLIEVLSSKEGVSIGGLDFKHSLLDLQDGDVEGAAAQIVHGDAATQTQTGGVR